MDPVVAARTLVVILVVLVTAVAVAPCPGGAEEDDDAGADDEIDSQGMLQSPDWVVDGDGESDVFIISLPGSSAGRGGWEHVTPTCGGVTYSVPMCTTG